MKEPTFGDKAAALLGVVGGAAGFVWLTALPEKPPTSQIILRFGFIAAFFSCLWLVTLCWAECFAHVARKKNWSPRGCVLAGVPFLVAGVLFFLLGNSQSFYVAGGLLFIQSLFAVGYARRLVFPGLSPEQAAAPMPPPSLFSK
jgi:hypothetical protein